MCVFVVSESLGVFHSKAWNKHGANGEQAVASCLFIEQINMQ